MLFELDWIGLQLEMQGLIFAGRCQGVQGAGNANIRAAEAREGGGPCGRGQKGRTREEDPQA